MATLKEFEEALRQQGMNTALSILEGLRRRDRAKRTVAPARRVSGLKMTPELARHILELHGTTKMTQQEIAFKLGVNQGRVNEVIKHGKWLSDDPGAPEAQVRDKAIARIASPVRRAAAETAPQPQPQPQPQPAPKADRPPFRRNVAEPRWPLPRETIKPREIGSRTKSAPAPDVGAKPVPRAASHQLTFMDL